MTILSIRESQIADLPYDSAILVFHWDLFSLLSTLFLSLFLLHGFTFLLLLLSFKFHLSPTLLFSNVFLRKKYLY